jgi:Ca2+/H+ antiporter
MNLDEYLGSHVYRSPFLGQTQTVSGLAAVFGALLSGPFYYWKKKAPVEALVLFTVELVLFVIPNRDLGGDVFLGSSWIGVALWLGAAAMAPVLLPMCYRRKGWIEII